jgi:hypothetical protein
MGLAPFAPRVGALNQGRPSPARWAALLRERVVGTKSRDFDEAEALRERNRKLREGLQECRELLKRTHALLETARRFDLPAND